MYANLSLASLFFGLSIPVSVVYSVFRLCPKYHIKKMEGYTIAVFALFAAAYGAHWWYLAIHKPDDWTSWFLLDGGLKSTGAIVGGLLAVFACSLFYNISILIGLTMALEAGVIALWVVRIGCAINEEHLGQPTPFFLAAKDNFGILRHNLGLYECLFLSLTLVPFVLITANKQPNVKLTALIIVSSYVVFKIGLRFVS